MVKKLENKLKKQFIVTLPRELPKDSNVPGYEDIEKIAGTFAGSPQSTVSHYLHRVHPEKAKFIVDILNSRVGGAEKYAFKIPEVRSLNGKEPNFSDKKLFTEMALASELAFYYNSSPFNYLNKARELLDWVGDVSADIPQA